MLVIFCLGIAFGMHFGSVWQQDKTTDASPVPSPTPRVILDVNSDGLPAPVQSPVQKPDPCRPLLTPGQEGTCYFHSQHPHHQDRFVFRRLGGKIHSCVDKTEWCRESKFGMEMSVCKCTAPGASAFNRGFIEIGAVDGLYLSNTLFFESQLNWTGLCVEANPDVYADLVVNRPTCNTFNAIASLDDSMEKLDYYSFLKYGSWEIGLSGLAGYATHTRTLRAAQDYAKSMGGMLKVHKVPVRRLTDMLLSVGITDIEYASIDVEGAEHMVLSTLDTEKNPTRLFRVEGQNPQVKQLLDSRGYQTIGGGPSIDAWYAPR